MQYDRSMSYVIKTGCYSRVLPSGVGTSDREFQCCVQGWRHRIWACIQRHCTYEYMTMVAIKLSCSQSLFQREVGLLSVLVAFR
jgi:hypothetical protein